MNPESLDPGLQEVLNNILNARGNEFRFRGENLTPKATTEFLTAVVELFLGAEERSPFDIKVMFETRKFRSKGVKAVVGSLVTSIYSGNAENVRVPISQVELINFLTNYK